MGLQTDFGPGIVTKMLIYGAKQRASPMTIVGNRPNSAPSPPSPPPLSPNLSRPSLRQSQATARERSRARRASYFYAGGLDLAVLGSRPAASIIHSILLEALRREPCGWAARAADLQPTDCATRIDSFGTHGLALPPEGSRPIPLNRAWNVIPDACSPAGCEQRRRRDF